MKSEKNHFDVEDWWWIKVYQTPQMGSLRFEVSYPTIVASPIYKCPLKFY